MIKEIFYDEKICKKCKTRKAKLRAVQDGNADFSYYFDDDGLTAAGGDYCYNLFIVAQSRNIGGFNEEEYQSLQTEIEELFENYDDIINKYECGGYKQDY